MFARWGYRYPNLWDEFSRLSREMEQLFSASNEPTRSGVFPPLNIDDDGESLIARAEIPGIDPQNLEVHATVNSLTIKGERKSEESEERRSYHRHERDYGSFSRSVTLPVDIDPDKVQASYKLGVLEVLLPKSADTKPRKVAIKS